MHITEAITTAARMGVAYPAGGGGPADRPAAPDRRPGALRAERGGPRPGSARAPPVHPTDHTTHHHNEEDTLTTATASIPSTATIETRPSLEALVDRLVESIFGTPEPPEQSLAPKRPRRSPAAAGGRP